jgi:hypothetical protein
MSDCQHRPDPLSDGTGANYTAWYQDVERRREQGRTASRWCPHCKRWVWADLWNLEVDDGK